MANAILKQIAAEGNALPPGMVKKVSTENSKLGLKATVTLEFIVPHAIAQNQINALVSTIREGEAVCFGYVAMQVDAMPKKGEKAA